jgi:pimeloyl-ACP methyl ester carboxylesterase
MCTESTTNDRYNGSLDMPFAHSADADIWWDSAGPDDGVGTETLLLLNGLGSPSATWFRVVRALRPTVRVVTIDNRGTGRTGVPEGPYPVSQLAADAVAVLDAAGVDKAHVLGLSLGGLIAQELALSFPSRVRSLVLAATHPGVPHATDPDPEVAGALVAAGSMPADERTRFLAPFLYAQSTPLARLLEDEQARAEWPTDPRGYTFQLVGASPWERLAELPSLDVPTLVLHGEDDRVAPVRYGERLASALPRATMVRLPGAGHGLFTDQEQLAAVTVRDFVLSHAEAVTA